MKLKVFSLALCLIVTALGERESLVSDDVYLRINECIHDYHHPFVRTSDESEAKALRDKAFAGLDDGEKIRALVEWMFRKPPPHYYGIASQAAKLLIAPEPVIKDYSELRHLISEETDSRRFYQLSMLSYSAEKNGHDFMPDRARGLFMEGVAADRGQSSTGHPLDSISKHFFSRITEELRDKSQTFKDEIYPELVKLDLKERNLELAKWLKANWPGCEDIEIPGQAERRNHRTSAIASETDSERERHGSELINGEKVSLIPSSLWIWVFSLFVLVAAIFVIRANLTRK